MVDFDPLATQQAPVVDIVAELAAAGFADGEAIGHGGFGVVYRCEQPALDRTVAVKVMTDHLEPASVERFVREQRAMGRLSGHPNIVSILEVGTTASGMPFIVMPYHPGGSLDAQIRADGPLDAAEVLRIGVKMAGAIEAAHRAGTLHRDIKPANILRTEYGEPELCDFGIARIAGGFETESNVVTGSPAFLAPELMIGDDPSVASDIYGLGATLFCALTGHAAFERRSGEQVIAHFVRVAGQQIDLRDKGIPAAVAVAIEAGMARDPQARPTSAYDFGLLLRDAQQILDLPVDDMAVPSESAVRVATTIGRGSRSGPITAPPTPATKFHPPVRPRAQVTRDRLLQVLRAGERRRLVVIHAPAGYGKTTVAVQWAEERRRAGARVSWLTTDDDDNNLLWFLTHLVESVARVDPDVTEGLADLLEEHRENAQRYVLTSLINAVHDRHEDMAIVIDDWHRVTDPAAQSALDFLLAHSCHHLQVVISSRSVAGLPMSRMRVADELVEIDIAGLCFDADEAQSFLLDVAGLDLATRDIDDLRDCTDGWVAGLQLASVSLRGADSPSELISNISGRHQAICDFLAENVLGSLDADSLNFLLTTAVPERICASLATALSGEPRGQARLEEMESRDLFLRRVDPDGDWFRYHPLFVEFLRRRLERDHAELVIPLHRKASEWFERHGMLVEAVQHSLAAFDEEHAVELVEEHGEELITFSQMGVLLDLTAKLPRTMVRSRPRIQLLTAWSNVMLGRPDVAAVALSRLDDAVEAMGGDAEIAAAGNIVRAAVDAIADRTDRIDGLVADVLDRPANFAPFYVSAAANLATISATARFDYEQAHRWQEWAVPFHRENIGQYAVMYGNALDGIAWMEQLELDRAEERFRDALAVSTRSGPTHLQSARLASALLASLLYERGELDESVRLFDESFKLAPEEGVVDMIIAPYVVGARIAVMRGDPTAAARYLDDAAVLAQGYVTTRLRAAIECEQAVLGLPARRGLIARRSFADREQADDGTAAVVQQYEDETAIRLLLKASNGAGDDADTALTWATYWVDRLRGTGRHRRRLCAERLLAFCLVTTGRLDEARVVVTALRVECASIGLQRFPFDGGEALRDFILGSVDPDIGSV